MAVDRYGDTLKIVQIVFYAVAGIAILTYRAAKRGLLNTVNTEYQKRVMDRLQKLSEDLYSEFESGIANALATIRPVHAAVEHINDVYERNKDEIRAARKNYYGTPLTDDTKRLHNLLQPVVSDPFIPDNIREAVIDLLENRIAVLHTIYGNEFEKYANDLAKGKHEPWTDFDDVNRIHNRIVEQLNARGCGISQIEVEVHAIRRLIPDYFAAFNPHRRWWHRRKRAWARPGACLRRGSLLTK